MVLQYILLKKFTCFSTSISYITLIMTDKYPLVTILMPSYNSERFIREAIESILNQTYTHFEFIIIDDGSSDKTISIIEEFHDSRIKLIHTPSRLGLAKSLNLGVSLANGIYIARMDTDDISYPYRIENQVSFLEKNPNCDIISGFIRLIDLTGLPLGTWEPDEAGMDPKMIDSILPWKNCVAHPSVLIRRNILISYPYDEDVSGAEDYELWLRLRYYGIIIDKLPLIILDYRLHEGSISILSNEHEKSFYNLSNARKKFLLNILQSPKCSIFPMRVVIAQIYDTARFFLTILFKKLRGRVHC
jgi:glycosyltransferase involved in cell wall biosynthesis